MKKQTIPTVIKLPFFTIVLLGLTGCQAPLPPGCPPGQLEPINSETKKAINPTQQYNVSNSAAVQTF